MAASFKSVYCVRVYAHGVESVGVLVLLGLELLSVERDRELGRGGGGESNEPMQDGLGRLDPPATMPVPPIPVNNWWGPVSLSLSLSYLPTLHTLHTHYSTHSLCTVQQV